MSPYVEVEHTADWSLRVWAPTRAALWVEAARGMYALMGARATLAPGIRCPVALQGGDDESLLTAWLQEWLYYTETQQLVFDDFEIDHLASGELRGSASGRPAAHLDKLIKAVTYHNLRITARDDGFEVTLVFDV
jgi:SHS2 domain-containing protein